MVVVASVMGIVRSGSAAAKRIVRSSGIEEAELAPEVAVSITGDCCFQVLGALRVSRLCQDIILQVHSAKIKIKMKKEGKKNKKRKKESKKKEYRVRTVRRHMNSFIYKAAFSVLGI